MSLFLNGTYFPDTTRILIVYVNPYLTVIILIFNTFVDDFLFTFIYEWVLY